MGEQTELSLADISAMMRQEQIDKINSLDLSGETKAALIQAYDNARKVVAKSFIDDFMLEAAFPSGDA